MIRKKGKNGQAVTKTSTNKVNAEKGKRGFQPTYNESFNERGYKMALLGLTDRQIAEAFGVGASTVEYWKKVHEDFRASVTAGRVEADAQVAASFYKKAVGYEYEDTAVLTNKVVEYDDNGKPLRSYNEPLLVPIMKHVPPDAWAANKWLSMRQREHWADTQKVDHRHLVAGSIDLNIDQVLEQITDGDRYSDEELRLAAKTGLENAQKQIKQSNEEQYG